MAQTVTPISRPIDDMFSLAYEELRRLASAVRRDDPAATINPTALVSEAWIKLAVSRRLSVESPLHFKRLAARAMRQVLVEAARRRKAAKRAGGRTLLVFDEMLGPASEAGQDVLALDDALRALAEISQRQSQIVEGRFFGGLESNELATVLGISEATVLRDWRAARAWLARELGRR